MRKKHKWVRLILLVLFVCFCAFTCFNIISKRYARAINSYVNYIDSTKEWQDLANQYLIKRDELIDDVLKGKYLFNRKYLNVLRSFECPPLLDGDAALMELMVKKPALFTDKIDSVNIEYGNITQLTEDKVVMTARVSYIKNNIQRSNNCEIVFANVDGKWLLSQYGILD